MRLFKFVLTGLILIPMISLIGCEKRSEQTRKEIPGIGSTNWPIFRGDNRLSGIATASLPEKLKILWSFNTQGAIKSSAVIGLGHIYIGSDDGSIYALDLNNGSKEWQFDTEGDVEAAPLLVDSIIYAGSVSGFFYALHALDGRLIWKYKTDGQIHGSANWFVGPDNSEKWIMVGSYDNRLYCFEARTGKLQWTYETEYFINGTAATDGEKAVFGGCDEVIHIVSVLTGEKMGEVESGSYIAGSAAFVDEKAYVGHYGNRLICVDINSQQILWEYGDKKTAAFFSSPAVNKTYVIIGGRDRYLHCVDRESGKSVWKFRTRDEVDSSPVICDKQVLTASKDGTLYIIDIENGSELGSYDLGAAISGSPAVSAGKIVIGAEDGTVYALGER